MKYLSLFSGIGGFELGVEQAYELQKVGIKSKNSTDIKSRTSQYGKHPLCIGYSEIDKYAIQIYEKHYPSHKNYGDITTINAKTLPDFSFLIGGFPCQSFSIAGKRGGFMDTRGTLFFDIARILQAKQPTMFLLENVKGLLSHDSGATFKTIISTLTELGYNLQWQVLNSKNFGVPQNRERVFIIGHLRGTSRSEIFPFGSGDKKNIENNKGETVGTIGARYWKMGQNDTYILHNIYEGFKSCNRGISIFKNYSPTIRTAKGGGHIPSLLKNSKIRRLTPLECERLQGFPDGWTEGLSDTQRYKTLGNAVTVNVIKAIAEQLL